MSVLATLERAKRPSPTRVQLVARVAGALLGSYAFGWGFIALGVAGGSRLMPFGEAQTLAELLVFLVLVACLCWAFAVRSVALVWGVLAGAGALMTLAGWLLSGKAV